MCASYSCRKCFNVVNTGVTAASPKAHSVLPAMLPRCSPADRGRASALPALDAAEDLVQPVGALAARRALAASIHGGRSAARFSAATTMHVVSSRTTIAADRAATRLSNGVEARLRVELIGMRSAPRIHPDHRLERAAARAPRRRDPRSARGASMSIAPRRRPPLHVTADAVEFSDRRSSPGAWR